MTQRGELVSRPVITISVDNVDDTLERVRSSGGSAGRRADPGRGHGRRRLLHRQRGEPDGPLAERRLTTGRALVARQDAVAREQLRPGRGRRGGARARDGCRGSPRTSGTPARAVPDPASGRSVRTARSSTFFGVCSSGDELDDLDVVARELEQAGASGVGDLGDEPLAQRPVPQQRSQHVVVELAEQLVLAARHGEDDAGAARARRGRAPRPSRCRRRGG